MRVGVAKRAARQLSITAWTGERAIACDRSGS
jgi:hypothetical protein